MGLDWWTSPYETSSLRCRISHQGRLSWKTPAGDAACQETPSWRIWCNDFRRRSLQAELWRWRCFFWDEHICENDLRKFGVRAVFEPSFFLRSLMIKSLGTYSWFPLWCLIDQWTLIWPTEWTKANKALSCKIETGPSHLSYMCFTCFFPISDGV